MKIVPYSCAASLSALIAIISLRVLSNILYRARHRAEQYLLGLPRVFCIIELPHIKHFLPSIILIASSSEILYFNLIFHTNGTTLKSVAILPPAQFFGTRTLIPPTTSEIFYERKNFGRFLFNHFGKSPDFRRGSYA